MKSGLEDRNNYCTPDGDIRIGRVSMKSGLEDRNNGITPQERFPATECLNEVRPGRPEQLTERVHAFFDGDESQ